MSDGTLPELLAAAARRRSEGTAVVAGERRFSYRELLAATNLERERLAGHGIGRGSVVALVGGNCPEFVVAFHALAGLGCVVLLTNPTLRRVEVLRNFAYAGVSAVVTTAELAPAVRHTLEDAPSLLVVVIGGRAYGPVCGELPAKAGGRAPVADDDAVFQFTTGSMGRPKAVRRTHANLVAEGDVLVNRLEMTSADSVLAAIPLFHSYGVGNCLVSTLRAGATLVLAERFIPRGTAALIQQEKVTVFPGVPFIWNLLGQHAPAGSDLSSLRLAISAGAPLLPEHFDVMVRRRGVVVRQQYGCTEAGAIAVNSEDDVIGSARSVGKPIEPIAVRVVDGQGADCGPGREGEIVVSSPRMAVGYVGGEESGPSQFREGWFHSGDIGTIDTAGRLHLLRRLAPVVSTAGNKVDPAEVEAVLSLCPGVREAVVLGVRQASGDEIVKAVVVNEGDCSREQVITHCRQSLAEFKIPRVVEFRDALPRSPLGKVLRGELV